MADAVKRRYDSSRRREQATQTRRQILEAAQRRFERDGYAATTVAAIAAEAGVATKTVYLAFDTKSGVLRALWNTLLRGEPDDDVVPARRWYQDVLSEPDPEQRLRTAAHQSRVVKERAGAVLDVIRTAAPSAPDIDGLWQRIQTEFRAVLRPVVESLDRDGALRPGLDVDQATDILWMHVHPDVCQLLVNRCGWSMDRYEQWCAESLIAQLLGR